MFKGPTLPNISKVKSAFHIPNESTLGLKTDEGSFGLSSKLTCRKKKNISRDDFRPSKVHKYKHSY